MRSEDIPIAERVVFTGYRFNFPCCRRHLSTLRSSLILLTYLVSFLCTFVHLDNTQISTTSARNPSPSPPPPFTTTAIAQHEVISNYSWPRRTGLHGPCRPFADSQPPHEGKGAYQEACTRRGGHGILGPRIGGLRQKEPQGH